MDLVLSLVFFYLVFNGFYKGFTGFVLKTIGFIVGVYISLPVYKLISPYFSKIFSGSFFLLDFFSFFLVFLVVLSTFVVVERLIKGKLYKRKRLALTDRVLGGMFGFFVFVFLVFFLMKFEKESPLAEKLLSKSKIVEIFKKI